MKELIYYPGFEITDPDWLKFALLYIQKLDPIIPKTGDEHLSAEYRKLMDETDLIEPYRPGYHEGLAASKDAVELFEEILRYPRVYSPVFGGDAFIKQWRNKKQ